MKKTKVEKTAAVRVLSVGDEVVIDGETQIATVERFGPAPDITIRFDDGTVMLINPADVQL